jgi:hypothetical protein
MSMELGVQIAMGLSIAACAGLRAFLPLLAVGLLSHMGYLQLNPAFSFLARTDALIVFGVATVLEILADKVVAVDHALDGISTFIRPVAGTLLAGSLLNHLDPLPAAALGIIVGGGPSLTVHAGKSVARYKASLLTPFHGGLGNMAISVVEDIISTFGIWIAVIAPIFAAVLGIMLLALAVWVLMRFAGVIRRAFGRDREPAPVPHI